MTLVSFLVGSLPVLLSAHFGGTGDADFMEAMQVQPDFMMDAVDHTVDEPTGKVITFGLANMSKPCAFDSGSCQISKLVKNIVFSS